MVEALLQMKIRGTFGVSNRFWIPEICLVYFLDLFKLLPILMTQSYRVFAMHLVGTSAFEIVNNAVSVLGFFARFLFPLPLSAQNLISNSPYCLLYNSYDASSENLVLDQLENPYTYPFHYSHHLSD